MKKLEADFLANVARAGLKPVNLDDAKRGNYYTIAYAGGELREWVDGYNAMLEEQEIGKPTAWYYCKGRDLNNYVGKRSFRATKTVLLFPLDGLDISRLAPFKIRMGDHWLDDMVSND